MKKQLLTNMFVISLIVIFSGCSKEPGYVIKDFYGAKTWEEKKEFILDADGLKPSDLYDEEADYRIEEILFEKKIDENTSMFKVTRLRKKSDKEQTQIRHFLITNVADKEKIDFKTMIGYNKIDLLQYCQAGLSGPTKFWVEVKFKAKSFSFSSYDKDHDRIELYDGKLNSLYLPLKTNEYSEDIKKLKDIAINNREALVLVEISQKAEMNWIDQYFVRPENVKFLGINPLPQE
ncbi:MAG: hypothetical protein LC102_11055 [Ignavibacteriales bacterium]|nr:MAG: hypothetical protein F9K26_05835 [Ignavibacteriaceae bacterium]MBW7873728.1 hypothetical protein [Ignavibacteria bacterium]MCZ2143953.1 hypothetical protein [Ignavibacteriales bacterium]OQY74532.1 MAG: hypothetical protein B6D45_06760 [Ignavibacteriales bacterium UTCHB3]MBV6444629.1 hypothetical protein [Ignavibacteriaceae bacterium]